jgi:putative FmdB family regulatory protein
MGLATTRRLLRWDLTTLAFAVYYTPVLYIGGGDNMPIYEYRCNECGERFELFVRSVADQITPACPKCDSLQVQKSISLFGVGSANLGSQASAAVCGPGPT